MFATKANDFWLTANTRSLTQGICCCFVCNSKSIELDQWAKLLIQFYLLSWYKFETEREGMAGEFIHANLLLEPYRNDNLRWKKVIFNSRDSIFVARWQLNFKSSTKVSCITWFLNTSYCQFVNAWKKEFPAISTYQVFEQSILALSMKNRRISPFILSEFESLYYANRCWFHRLWPQKYSTTAWIHSHEFITTQLSWFLIYFVWYKRSAAVLEEDRVPSTTLAHSSIIKKWYFIEWSYWFEKKDVKGFEKKDWKCRRSVPTLTYYYFKHFFYLYLQKKVSFHSVWAETNPFYIQWI